MTEPIGARWASWSGPRAGAGRRRCGPGRRGAWPPPGGGPGPARGPGRRRRRRRRSRRRRRGRGRRRPPGRRGPPGPRGRRPGAGHLLGAAREPALLGTPGGADERRTSAAAVGVAEGEQQRQLDGAAPKTARTAVVTRSRATRSRRRSSTHAAERAAVQEPRRRGGPTARSGGTSWARRSRSSRAAMASADAVRVGRRDQAGELVAGPVPHLEVGALRSRSGRW